MELTGSATSQGEPMKVMQRVGRFAVLAVIMCLAGVCLKGSMASAQGEAKKNTKFPQLILIIRHAEKTGEKTDIHLSAQGKERAAVLYQLFVTSKSQLEPFPVPDFIFAATKHKDSQRPVETVTPYATKLKLPVNDKYNNKLAAPGPGMRELRDEIFGQPKYFGKIILVAWRHSTIPALAKTFNVSNAPAKWEDNVFDRVWQISYDDQGKAGFVDRPQRLLPGDAEK
jgi:hypothetical protein